MSDTTIVYPLSMIESPLIVDNLKLEGNTVSSTDTDGDINLVPDGTGSVTSTVNGSSQVLSQKSPETVEVFNKQQFIDAVVSGKKDIFYKVPLVFDAGDEMILPDVGNMVIRTSDRSNTITYSGTTGTLFSASARTGNLSFFNVDLFGGLNTSRMCNLNCSGFVTVTFDNCAVYNWGSISILSGLGIGLVLGNFVWSGNLSGMFNITNSGFLGLENSFGQNFSDTGSTQFVIGSDVDRISLTISGFVAQPNETFLDINSSFTGEVIINTMFGIPTGQVFDITGLGKDSIYVNSKNVSNNQDSKSIGSFTVAGNTQTTALVSDTWTDLDLNTNATAASNIEEFTLMNATTGELRYDGLSPFSGKITCVITVEPNGSRKFNFRALKNGLVLPDPSIASLDIGSGSGITVPFLASINNVVTNDLIKLQIFEEGGTFSPLISDMNMDIS